MLVFLGISSILKNWSKTLFLPVKFFPKNAVIFYFFRPWSLPQFTVIWNPLKNLQFTHQYVHEYAPKNWSPKSHLTITLITDHWRWRLAAHCTYLELPSLIAALAEDDVMVNCLDTDTLCPWPCLLRCVHGHNHNRNALPSDELLLFLPQQRRLLKTWWWGRYHYLLLRQVEHCIFRIWWSSSAKFEKKILERVWSKENRY